MMQVIKQEFNDRVAEIGRYFHLLDNIIEKEAQLIFPNELDRREDFDFDLSGTLKSSAILLLYNLIEASVSKCLELIHQVVTQDKLMYDSVSDSIQKIWLAQFYERFRETGNKDENVLNNLKFMVDTLIRNNVAVELIYRDKEKRSSETSGILDAKKIREIADKYGIDFNKTSDKLKDIKDKRINLAHGIQSFLDCCNTMTFKDLSFLKNEAIEFLEAFIFAVDAYLVDKKYKNKSSN